MKLAWFQAVVLLAACSAAPQAAPPARPASPDPVTLTPVLVASGPRVATLEVHIYAARALGQAELTVSGPGVQVQPQVPVAFALQPPPPPPPVHATPYPLPPVTIRVFRLQAAGPGPHTLEVSLRWSGGKIKRVIHWNDDSKGQ